MKKLLLASLFLSIIFLPCRADEVTEDFLDIAADYCVQGNYAEAVNYVNKAIAHEPDNPDLVTIKNGIYRIQDPTAQSYLTENNPQVKAAEEFRKAGNEEKEMQALLAGAEAKNPWATYYLAEFYRKKKQFNTALNYYDKTLELKQGFAQCYLGITLTLIEMNNYEAAMNAIAYYLDRCPKSDLGYALRADINLHLKNYVDAEADIITALSISNDIDYQLLEGEILYHRGSYKAAKEKLEKLTQTVKTAELYKYLGLCDYQLKDYNNALLNLNNSIILSDDDIEVKNKYNEVKDKLTNGTQNDQKKIQE